MCLLRTKDKQFGEAESGSHPWMALVVLSRQPQGILCYATIVHSRAAVTAADCVYGYVQFVQHVTFRGYNTDSPHCIFF